MKEGANKKYLPPEETAMFCEQMALVLKSGIPLYDGVEALSANYGATKFGSVFEKLNDLVKETGSLYEAVSQVDIFPPYMVNSIKVGERAGTLERVMEALAQYYNRESQVRGAIRHAITYPLVLIALMAVIIVVLVIKVLPVFTTVFRNLGTEMSDSSLAVMNFGLAAGKGVLILVALVMAVALVIFLLMRTSKREAVTRFFTRHIRPIGNIRRKLSAGRFASVMSMMLASGFPQEEALNLASDVLNDPDAKEKVITCLSMIEQGESFPDAIAKVNMFDPIYTKMIQMGYRTGQMDNVMEKLSTIYEQEMDDSIRRIVSLIEPTLVGILAVIIGAVLLAVMLPLASIMSAMSA